uniref:Uncharacterized protein n=1 Tax=Lepeophtheirus salmonis TaxID=72036 RepID=A0A0K2VBY3_LEPSM
MTEDYICSWC